MRFRDLGLTISLVMIVAPAASPAVPMLFAILSRQKVAKPSGPRVSFIDFLCLNRNQAGSGSFPLWGLVRRTTSPAAALSLDPIMDSLTISRSSSPPTLNQTPHR
jgi:hypothetical protein